RHVDAARAVGGDALRLLDATVDAPRGHHWQWEQALVRRRLHTQVAIVVHLQHLDAEVLVLADAEALSAEAERAGEDDLRVDAALVEDLQADLGVGPTEMDLLEVPLLQRLVRALLRPVARDDTARAVLTRGLAVEHPGAHTVDR